MKGSPFSSYDSPLMLLDLGMEPSDPVLSAVSDMFFGIWRWTYADQEALISDRGAGMPVMSLEQEELTGALVLLWTCKCVMGVIGKL